MAGTCGDIECVKSDGSLQTWRWTFGPLSTDVHGDFRDAEETAKKDLVRIQSMLFPEGLPAADWFDPMRRVCHLQRVKETARHLDRHRRSAAGQGALELATRLALPYDARTLQNDYPGFRNLGNTCYLNAVLQCIFHCDPLARALRGCGPKAGVISTALKQVLQDYVATGPGFVCDVISPCDVVTEICRHACFAPGQQQDAAECLRQFFRYVRVLGKVCDSGAALVDGGVLLCHAPDMARVSGAASAVDMRALLLEAVTGETALEQSPEALVVRLENTYEEGGELFWVNVDAKWPEEPYPITTKESGQAQTEYIVQAYLVHRRAAGAGVAQGMRSGHYIAYFKRSGQWYRADDEQVTLLAEPPTEFPYVVFLARSSRQPCRKMMKRAACLRELRADAPPVPSCEVGIREGASARRPIVY